MNAIRILAQTEDTVTISRSDLDGLLASLEDAEDVAAVRARRAHEDSVGKETARRDYLTGAETLRLIQGESPALVWREKRGLSQAELAAGVGLSIERIQALEAAPADVALDERVAIAAFLDVPDGL